ncbi:hypothetical protein ACDQ55_11010 [Chitinophaga sp. 30R24]|uniref:hypothetical protein n=1 Tax=Chitinophaga sp. 30R24 TaxID=3248838 RepID=UPI003B90EE8A
MSKSNNPVRKEDPPSWGSVIAGLLLGIAGITLIFYRYKQFYRSTGDESSHITKIEMLIYKVTGGNVWVLITAYAIIALIGLYLAISNFNKLRSK